MLRENYSKCEKKQKEYVKIIDYSFFVYSIWFSKTNFFNSKTKKR